MPTSYPHQATKIIQELAPNFKPKIGIVLGSGLGPLADSIKNPITISYEKLPGFPQLSVKGHASQMILGEIENVPVVCLLGRSHTYENNSYDEVKTYVRTLKLLGCEIFLATNASGSLRQEIGSGSLVAIRDHINFQPGNPLSGPNDDDFGPRFPPMDNTYDKPLRQILHTSAEMLGITLHEGVYISVLGPSYETAAEIRAFQILGAEVIGMSTVPEVIVAKHCGMRIAVVATITNLATGLSNVSHDHNEVVRQAEKASEKLTHLIKEFIKRIQR